MVLKPLKIIPPWYILLDYFITRPSFKNLYDVFLTKCNESHNQSKVFVCVSVISCICGSLQAFNHKDMQGYAIQVSLSPVTF